MSQSDLPIPAPGQRARLPAERNPSPPPVRATLIERPELYPEAAAEINIAWDERLYTPRYRINVDFETLLLTHAQLAALMLAANAIFSTCHPTGVPQ